MSAGAARGGGVTRLLRVGFTVADLARAQGFFRDALGFVPVREEAIDDPAWFRLMGVEGAQARSATMRLGAQEVEFTAFAPPGAPYPPGSTAADPWFQHIAIVVDDMAEAWARLRRHDVVPISLGGPQLLPPSTGSVTAFKFRDPDGHPLELIHFPPGTGDPAWQDRSAGAPCLGVDHSAIVVRDVNASVDFYTRLLGLTEASRSVNHGPEQQRLDGLPGDIVDVVALRPAEAATPHVELLGYRAPPVPPLSCPVSSRDIASTRLVFQADDLAALADALRAASVEFISPGIVTLRTNCRAALVRDPDGHAVALLQRAGASHDLKGGTP